LLHPQDLFNIDTLAFDKHQITQVLSETENTATTSPPATLLNGWLYPPTMSAQPSPQLSPQRPHATRRTIQHTYNDGESRPSRSNDKAKQATYV
jgi:hypothetical protein